MVFLNRFVVLLFAFSQYALASRLPIDSRALGIGDIPPCGLTCLLMTVPAAGCGLTDTECQCSSRELTYSTAACMLANCTMADSLGTAKVQADLCNLPRESKSNTVFLSLTVVFAIVCASVVLRIAAKIIAKRVRADDYFIILALFFTIATYVSACEMIENGFGKHLWDLKSGQLRTTLQYFYVCWNLYVITLGLVKASLVIFYLQIFEQRRFRHVCFGVLSYIAVSTIIIQFLTIFSCKPIRSFWNRDIKGTCLNINAIAYANSANAILQDLIILILPMPSLFKLKMKIWRKVAVGLMFAVGTFGCITTILRLHSLLSFSISIDPTWEYSDVTIWTGAELAAGIICASLPSIRKLLVMMIPHQFLHMLTNRTLSRNTPLPGRGTDNSDQKPRKGLSVFPLTNVSDPKSGSWGNRTDISSSTLTSTQISAIQGLEQGMAKHQGGARGNSFLPLRAYFQSKSRSFQTSFWSSFDRNGSPPLSPGAPPVPSKDIDPRSELDRTDIAQDTGKTSVDEQMGLLRSPPMSRRKYWSFQSVQGNEITALPQIGILPDTEYPHMSPPRARRKPGW